MTKPVLVTSPQSQARAAGGLWWLCIVAGIVGFVAGAPLIVANDATATAVNILAKESLFRLGFSADLISGLSYVGVIVFIYYVVKPVSRSLSLLGAFFGLAGVAIGGASWVIHLAPLLLLHGDQYLTAFTTSQLQMMSLAALPLQLQVFPIGMVFFVFQCMWMLYLVVQALIVPRLRGILLAVD